MDRFVFTQSFISLITLLAEISEALQADGITLNKMALAHTVEVGIK